MSESFDLDAKKICKKCHTESELVGDCSDESLECCGEFIAEIERLTAELAEAKEKIAYLRDEFLKQEAEQKKLFEEKLTEIGRLRKVVDCIVVTYIKEFIETESIDGDGQDTEYNKALLLLQQTIAKLEAK